MTEFPAFNGATLHIPYDVWRKIKMLTDEIPTEYMAYLLRDVDDYMATENPFRVDDLFVPDQAVSGGYVDMSDDGYDFNTLNVYCAENKLFAIGNIHSHVNFGVGPSGTDLHDNIERQLQQPGIFGYENGFMVTLIINKSGDLSARLDVLVDTKQRWWRKPVATFKMETHVDMPPDENIDQWVEEQKLKLRPLVYEHRGYMGGHHQPRGRSTAAAKTANKGLYPVNYFNQQCEGGRANAIKKRWEVIRAIIARGWTVAVDTRVYGNYQGLIVTRTCGNDDLQVPFVEDERINATRSAASQKKRDALSLLGKGNAIFMDPRTPSTLFFYSDEDGKCSGREVVRLVFNNDSKFIPDGKERSLLLDEHKKDYTEAIAALYDKMVVEDDPLMGYM